MQQATQVTFTNMTAEHAKTAAIIDEICFTSDNFSAQTINALMAQKTVYGTMLFIQPPQESQPAGYAMLQLFEAEGELLTISILPEYRGKGLGKKLLNHVITKAKEQGCKTLFLEVRTSNKSAKNLYKSTNWQQVGIRKNYYSASSIAPAEDAEVFQKQL